MPSQSRVRGPDTGPLAIGTAPLGGLYAAVDDDLATATLQRAAAGGLTHFDTAPHYGRGLAEKRLGRFLATIPDPGRFTVSTKVGRDVHATRRRHPDDLFLGAEPGESVFDFSVPAIHRQLAASRARLGRDRIDLVLLHDPDDHLDAAHRAGEELIRLRDDGQIGGVGVGTNSATVADRLLDRLDLDAVLLAGRITLLQTRGEAVAARCAQRGVRFLAAGVFQSGILAGAGADTYDYAPAPPPIRERVRALGDLCARHGVALSTLAVAHPARVPGVHTTLVGVRSPGEVDAALDAQATVVDPTVWEAVDELRATWTDPPEQRNRP